MGEKNWRFEPPKTKKSRRTLALEPEMAELLPSTGFSMMKRKKPQVQPTRTSVLFLPPRSAPRSIPPI